MSRTRTDGAAATRDVSGGRVVYRETVTVLAATDIYKSYRHGGRAVEAVRGVTLTLAAGEHVSLVGPSGCGKSTLLHICGAMDRPTQGDVSLEGHSMSELDDDALTRVRRRRIGFVFQFFNLLPTLTVRQNIGLPLLLDGHAEKDADGRTESLAARVGLSSRLDHYPQQLSGGEAQRAAMARAVIHRPAVLIADEPTGNLDTENGSQVLDLLLELNVQSDMAILLATHDPAIAAKASRIVRMRDGIEIGS